MKAKKIFKSLLSSVILFGVVGCGMLRGNEGASSDKNPITSNESNSQVKPESKSSSESKSNRKITINDMHFESMDNDSVCLKLLGTHNNCEGSIELALKIEDVSTGKYVVGTYPFSEKETYFKPSNYTSSSFTFDISFALFPLHAGSYSVEFMCRDTKQHNVEVVNLTKETLEQSDYYYNYTFLSNKNSNLYKLDLASLAPFEIDEGDVIKDKSDKTWIRLSGLLNPGWTLDKINKLNSYISLRNKAASFDYTIIEKAKYEYVYRVEDNKRGYLYIDISFINDYKEYSIDLNMLNFNAGNIRLCDYINVQSNYMTSMGLTKYALSYLPVKGPVENYATCGLYLKIEAADPWATKSDISNNVLNDNEIILDKVEYTSFELSKVSGKPTLKLSGYIHGKINSSNSIFAFGIVEFNEETYRNWVTGSHIPSENDYKYTPTINGNQFSISFDLSEFVFYEGQFHIFAGPRNLYMLISTSYWPGTISDQLKVNGGKVSLREDVSLLVEAQDKIDIDETYLREENGEIYHYLGGVLNVSEDEFLSIPPTLIYETTVGSWKQYRMNYDTYGLEKLIIDGKGFIRCKVSTLPAERYLVHPTFFNEHTTDIIFDELIDTSNEAIIHNGNKFYLYADSSYNDRQHIYGSLGLVIEHVHNIVASGDKVSQAQPIICDTTSKDIQGFELHTDDMMSGQIPNLEDVNTRLGKGIIEDVWNINGVQSGEYEMHLFCAAKDEATLGVHWDGRIDIENGADPNYHGGSMAGYRFTFKSGDGEYIEPTTTKTMGETGAKLLSEGFGVTESLGTIMIADGDQTFTIKSMNNGYSIFIEGIRLIRIGDYKAPPHVLVFDQDNTDTIEAEHYQGTSNRATVQVVEGENTSNGRYLSGMDAYGEEVYYDIKVNENVVVDIYFVYNCYEDPNNYGACEFYIDGVEVSPLDRGELSDGWATQHIANISISRGEHQIKIRNPYRTRTDYDCFRFVKIG